ncbi:CRISPR-associated helicase Cas3' [Breoghania sp.]|uniref:CRISPR-associated helicase Cas3' n=1 Tax=Breoghania sp. TaxID=2065378 RepID=UPI002AAB2956|nr:CRISPR-associated helicase Cas3' [Breoghania sp.]
MSTDLGCGDLQGALSGATLEFWGKSREDELLRNGDRSPLFKPVLHHLLDVAAVTHVWQAVSPARCVRDAEALNVPPEALARMNTFLVGLHDLGKFSRSFQCKRADFWPERVLGPFRSCADRGHWRNTAILLRADRMAAALADLLYGSAHAGRADLLTPVIAAISGHHGRPPGAEEIGARAWSAADDLQIGSQCVAHAEAAFALLRQVVAPTALDLPPRLAPAVSWSWRLSGLTTLADWVGSDAAFFGFQPLDMPLDRYWTWACEQARDALRAKGLMPPAPFSAPGLARVAREAAEKPRPMQALAASLPLEPGPQLVIVEDTTGAGKTEAALVLAARMMAEGKGEGLFFAMPTMATANAMYERLSRGYRALFEDHAAPSLVLAHGRSDVSGTFLETIGAGMTNGAGAEETAAAFCAGWLADSRKKAFLADVGAATIDQAFLAVLPKKHLTLRQFALAGRILVIDEAHSYDAYMEEELRALLSLQAMSGGSAIILSATLSGAQKGALVTAFGEGLGLRDPEDLAEEIRSDAYPLATSLAKAGVSEIAPGFDAALAREVTIERVSGRPDAVARALEAAGKGAAVAIICNAVDEAIAVHETIRAAIDQRAHLFHARFAQGDRQEIEEAMLARFGKKATAADRAGHVLVATQVIEQSLDLDFDLIITDLAPIDLLIQRAGRLWRHMGERPTRVRALDAPRLLVVSPDPALVEDETWLEPVLGKAAFTYAHPGIMWRTAREIFDAGAIRTPESFRPMIEAVYRGDDWSDVPKPLGPRLTDAEGTKAGQKSLGRMNVIKLADGYGALSDSLGVDEDIGTRLGEPTVTLRLARIESGRLLPWFEAQDQVSAWALSEVRVRTKWLGLSHPCPDDALRRMAKADWPEWEQGMPIGVVDEDGKVTVGANVNAQLFYGKILGFRRS